MRIAPALVLLACACGKSEKSELPPESGLAKLKVSAHGKAIPMTKAFIARRADGTYRLVVSDGDGSCAELFSSLFNHTPNHMSFTATIATLLDPKGKETHVVTDVAVTAEPKTPKRNTAFVGGTAAEKGKQTPVQLDLAESEVGLAIAGQFDAEGCGDAPMADTGVKAPHPSTAIMWIGTKKFSVVGATVRGDTVTLLDLPKDCSPATMTMGARLTTRGGTWTLDGTRFAGESVGDVPKLSVVPGADGTSPDGPTMQLALSGSGKIGDYPVSLEGTVEALDCK